MPNGSPVLARSRVRMARRRLASTEACTTSRSDHRSATIVAARSGERADRSFEPDGASASTRVPLVAYDGTDGRTLGRRTSRSSSARTAAARPSRQDALRRPEHEDAHSSGESLVLAGSWSFDAISPDGSMLYLTEHLRAGDDPLVSGPAVDPQHAAASGCRSSIGSRARRRWAAAPSRGHRAPMVAGRTRSTHVAVTEPFVHALDTAKREAFCIDLPLRLGCDRADGATARAERGTRAVRAALRRQAARDGRHAAPGRCRR